MTIREPGNCRSIKRNMVRHQTALKPRQKEQLHMFQHLIPHYHPRLPRNVRHTQCLRRARYSAFIVTCGGGERFKSMSISGDLTPTPPKKITPLAFFPPTVSWKILYVFSWGGERFKSMSISVDLTPTPPKKDTPLAFFPPTVSWKIPHVFCRKGGTLQIGYAFQQYWWVTPLKLCRAVHKWCHPHKESRSQKRLQGCSHQTMCFGALSGV